jgi:hypothetical protein
MGGGGRRCRGILLQQLFRRVDMGQAVLRGNPPVEITLRRTKAARRVSLRVSALDGRVTLSMPKHMDMSEALAFAEEKSDWIRKHLAQRLADVVPRIGGSVLYQGQEVAIRAAAVRKAVFADGAFMVPNAPAMATARIKAFLRLAAQDRLFAASRTYAAQLGQNFGKISLRDTRSRWGSCSAKRDLMYSWRLIMAPPEVLNYVVAHEVSHLVEMNHSPAYWKVVARIFPAYAAPRAWLRQNGQTLHRYRFDD